MALVLQDEGLLRKLEDLRAAWNSVQLKMHLFQNNYTPLNTSVLGDFTEATFSGYTSQNIATWGVAAVAAHVGTITPAPLTFTRNSTGAGQTIYGYYVTDAGFTKLYWAERDPAAPVTLTNNGDSYTITAQMQDMNV